MSSIAKKKASAGNFRVGDRVTFTFGDKRISGTIIEDRGRIGVKGRRLFAIRARLDHAAESIIEIPAEELRHRPRAA